MPTWSSSEGQHANVPSVHASSYPTCDVLLHCGDLTNTGTLDEYQHALSMLNSIEAELKLVIAGNHDLTLDESYYRSPNKRGITSEDHEKAKAFWLGHAKSCGVTYLEEGMHTFTLRSGSTFTVSNLRYRRC